MRVHLAVAVALLLAGCATGPFDRRSPWETAVWASPVDPGVYAVRVAVTTPDQCFAPGETRTGPSTAPEAIQLQVNVTRVSRPCAASLGETLFDIPGLRVEPDDRSLELVVSSEGVERNRILVDFAALGPSAGAPYTSYYPPESAYARPPRY